MKLLIVVRHAQASWSNVMLNDYERPLKKSGIQDAKQVSQYLIRKKYSPDYIISSAATRTIETAIIFSKTLTNLKLTPKKDPLMYGASSKQLLELIAQINDNYNTVMVVGHNPTITSLINIISDVSIDHAPTSSTGVIEFNMSSWKNILDTEGKLIEFIYPKKLKLL